MRRSLLAKEALGPRQMSRSTAMSNRTRVAGIVMFIIMIAMIGCSPNSSAAPDGAIACERFRLVVLNGLAVANPDYQVHWSYHQPFPRCDDQASAFHGSMEVGLSPRLSGPVKLSEPMLRTAIKQDSEGLLPVPAMGEWRMSEALEKFQDGSAWPSKSRTTAQLRQFDKNAQIQVVVRLRNPLREDQVLAMEPSPDVLFFSPGGVDKPLGWDWATSGLSCDSRGFDFCQKGKPSATADFRRWVSLLREEDEGAFERLGLQLSEVRSRADEGLIYGFVMQNLPGVLIHRLADSRISHMGIVDVAIDPWR